PGTHIRARFRTLSLGRATRIVPCQSSESAFQFQHHLGQGATAHLAHVVAAKWRQARQWTKSGLSGKVRLAGNGIRLEPKCPLVTLKERGFQKCWGSSGLGGTPTCRLRS